MKVALTKPPKLEPLPRMKRRLAASIHSDTGLLEGEAWWIGPVYMVLLCREQFDLGKWLEVRIDLGGFDGDFDARARVIEHGPSRTRRGLPHCVQWFLKDETQQTRVTALLHDLNPDAFEKAVATPAAPSAAQRNPPRPSQPQPTRPPRRPVRPRQTPAQQPASPGLTPQFSRGNPGALFVPIDSRKQLAQAITIRGTSVRLVLPRVPGPAERDRVTIALRLYNGMFVQLDARVRSMRRLDLVLEANKVAIDVRTVLRQLLNSDNT